MHIYLLDSVVEFPIPQNPNGDLTQVLTLLTSNHLFFFQDLCLIDFGSSELFATRS